MATTEIVHVTETVKWLRAFRLLASLALLGAVVAGALSGLFGADTNDGWRWAGAGAGFVLALRLKLTHIG